MSQQATGHEPQGAPSTRAPERRPSLPPTLREAPLNTPLVQVRLEAGAPTIWCKLEFLNASGSTKDRIARYMLQRAWERGDIGPGRGVVEASSGSTSMALAMCCARLGLPFTAVMPASVSPERVTSIRAYGARVELIDADAGILAAIHRAQQLASAEGLFHTRQFENPDNALAHEHVTGPEILSAMGPGPIDAVVSGVGTGGTIVGLYRGLGKAHPGLRPVVARPMTGHCMGGIECCSFSARVPGVVDGVSRLYREARLPGVWEIEVDDKLALETTRTLIASGFPVGPSSGLNYAAALAAARRLGPDARIVTVFADRMERYFSTEMFADLRQP